VFSTNTVILTVFNFEVDRKMDEPSEEVLAALDDGFADFQSSTNFNDITNFFSNSMSVEVPTTSSVLPFLVTNESAVANPSVPVQVTMTLPNSTTVTLQPVDQTSVHHAPLVNGRKRAGDSKLGPNVPKKKTTATRRPAQKKTSIPPKQTNTVSPVAVSSSVVNVVVAKPHETAGGTPNPLPYETVSADAAKPKVVFSKKGGVQHNVKVVMPENRAVPVTSAPSTRAPSASNAAAAAPLMRLPTQATEADFKDGAQAAVSELITSVAVSSDEIGEGNTGGKVDTSTAHIKALTGTNWVSGSNGVTTGIDGPLNPVAPSFVDNSDAKSIDSNSNSGINRCKRQSLTADERARQNRDRNREHARNTRLRKKAYVEELKQTLTEMVQQRDAADLEKRQSAQRELEQREVRFRVVEEFLKLRGRNESNAARWSAILEEEFVFTVPSINSSGLQRGHTLIAEKSFSGVKNSMEVSANFSSFLQSSVGENCMFQHLCDRKEFFMDGCTAFLEWNGNCVDAAGTPLVNGISLKGVVRAKYSPASNKLISITMTFDTNILMDYLNKSSSSAFQTNLNSNYEVVSAEVAASQANAIIDSLQMPCMTVNVPADVSVEANSSSSDFSINKSELSGDESL
jgi:hypothetical protein